jgi:hypothetical protein
MSKPAGKRIKYKIAATVNLPDSVADAGESPVLESAPTTVPVSWICAIAFSAGAALLAASTIAVVIRTYSPLPKWDHWAEILWLKHYYAGQWQISDLWRQHNEHRILFPRLFLLTDWFLFRGKNIFLLFSILLLQAAHAWIFLREVRNWRELSRALRLTVAAIIVILFFSGANLDNFTWPFQISFILAFYAGTVSLYSLIRYAEKCGKRKARMAAVGWLAASAGSGIVATHSLSNGILIWPVLLLTGIVLRLHRRILVLIGIIFGLVALQYFSGYHLIAGHGNAVDALRHPLAVLGFVGAYLAIPVAKIEHAVGALVGLSLLSAFAWTAFRILRRRRVLPRLVVLNLSVMLYIAATAFLTALGRLAVAPPETSLRYATPVCIFWACALMLALAEAETWQQRSAAVAAVLATTITGLIVTIVPLHVERCFATLQFAQAVQETEVAVLSQVDAKAQIALLYPDPEYAFSLIDVLRVHHRSVFAGNQIAAAELLPPEYQVVSRDRCRGTWEVTTSANGPGQPGASVNGWGWDNTANRRPDRIVFLDASRMVRGFAAFTRDRGDVAAAFQSSRMVSSGWSGFTEGVPGFPPYRAYALLNDGRSVCPLNNLSEVSSPFYSVFRQGQWVIDTNKNGTWDLEDRVLQFGLTGDVPVTGDWDGSGVIRAGVFRNGQWFLDWNNNGRWDEGDREFSFGMPGDLPVTGDWNHNGITKAGVFRNGIWILDWNGEQRFSSHSRQFSFGAPGDIPVTGNWDGPGATRIGVFRRGIWYLDNGDFQLDVRDKVATFGLADDRPITGDWNGLGVTKIGVFRNGQWILDSIGKLSWDPRDSSSISFGLSSDIPVLWKK